jgi:hypothetical protein
MVKWYGNLKKDIVGIPLEEETPPWICSSMPPEWQLEDLGRRADYLVSEFKDYEKDLELEKLIDGKTIAFVGPAPSLVGTGMGEKIDSYDLVIRINTAYDIPEELWEDYGKRTDILVSCLNFNKIRSLKDNMPFVESLKYLIQPNLSMWDIRKGEAIINEWDVPFHNVCDGYLFKVDKEVGTTCNTGLLGIVTLLNYDIKELYIAGFTFFNMGTNQGDAYHSAHLEQTIKYDPIEIVNNRPTGASLRFDLHAAQPQIDYFGKILEHHHGTKVQVDDYLANNFNLSINRILVDKTKEDKEKIKTMDKFLKEFYNLTITKWEGEI